MSSENTTVAALQARIAQLEKEVQALQDVSLFADIRPSLEEQPARYKQLKIATVGLQYTVRYAARGIVRELYERLARDLHKPLDQFELLDPGKGKEGTRVEYTDELADFLDDGGVIRLDFRYIEQEQEQCCEHGEHGHGDSDYSDFSDDENFYTSCSCAHHT
jgi:hypothetical protein